MVGFPLLFWVGLLFLGLAGAYNAAMDAIRFVELGAASGQDCRTQDCFWAKVRGNNEGSARVFCKCPAKEHRLGPAKDGGMALAPVLGRRKSRACDGCRDFLE